MQTELASWLQRLPAAPQRLLMLDYDGTLAPFTVERAAAAPYPGVEAQLKLIIGTGVTRLVLISGRPVEELEQLIPLAAQVECWGSHGLTRRQPGYLSQQLPLADTVLVKLQDAAEHARTLGFGDFLEVKAGCVALHWRGQSPAAQELMLHAVMPVWLDLCDGPVKLREFDGGLEIMQQTHTKGTAVEMLLAEMPEAATAYLGDDATDEDAFRRLQGRGAGILVHAAERPTQAGFCLRPPDELLEFLDAWAQITQPVGGASYG